MAFAAVGSLPAFAGTHLGQHVNDHVMLTFNVNGSGSLCSAYNGNDTLYMERVMPDVTAQHFVVPKGKRLIITDFDVQVAPSGVLPRAGGGGRRRLRW